VGARRSEPLQCTHFPHWCRPGGECCGAGRVFTRPRQSFRIQLEDTEGKPDEPIHVDTQSITEKAPKVKMLGPRFPAGTACANGGWRF
jgi:hypothetical protein